MIKKLYPWIPIVGLVLVTFTDDPEAAGMHNKFVALMSGVWQGVCLVSLTAYLL